MSKALLGKKNEALKMRSSGMSYSQIKDVLGVSKSSLSLWLREFPLSKQRVRELRDRNEQRIERYRNTMRLKRETRLSEVYKKQQFLLLPLTNKELLIAGLCLYWGEGGKTANGTVTISNTSPEIIIFSLMWLTKILGVEQNKIVIRLHLYSDMDISRELNFWSKKTTIPAEQFRKPYIKKATLKGITYKGFGHGTCNVIVHKRDLHEQIIMGIKVIADLNTVQKQSNY